MPRKSRGNEDDEYAPTSKQKALPKSSAKPASKSAPKSKATQNTTRPDSPPIPGAITQILRPSPKLNRPTKKARPKSLPSPELDDEIFVWDIDTDLSPDESARPTFNKKDGNKKGRRKAAPSTKKPKFRQLELDSDIANDEVKVMEKKVAGRGTRATATGQNQGKGETKESGEAPDLQDSHLRKSKSKPQDDFSQALRFRKDEQGRKVGLGDGPPALFPTLAKIATFTPRLRKENKENEENEDDLIVDEPDRIISSYKDAEEDSQITHHRRTFAEDEGVVDGGNSTQFFDEYDLAERVTRVAHSVEGNTEEERNGGDDSLDLNAEESQSLTLPTGSSKENKESGDTYSMEESSPKDSTLSIPQRPPQSTRAQKAAEESETVDGTEQLPLVNPPSKARQQNQEEKRKSGVRSNKKPPKVEFGARLRQAIENAGESVDSLGTPSIKGIKKTDTKPKPQHLPLEAFDRSRLKHLPPDAIVDDRAVREPNIVGFDKNGPRNQGISTQKIVPSVLLRKRVPPLTVNEQGSPIVGNYDLQTHIQQVFDLIQQPDAFNDEISYTNGPDHDTRGYDSQDYDDAGMTMGSVPPDDEMEDVPTQVEIEVATKINQRPTGVTIVHSESVGDVVVPIVRPPKEVAKFRQPAIETDVMNALAQSALNASKRLLQPEKSKEFVHKSIVTQDKQITNTADALPPPQVAVKRTVLTEQKPPTLAWDTQKTSNEGDPPPLSAVPAKREASFEPESPLKKKTKLASTNASIKIALSSSSDPIQKHKHNQHDFQSQQRPHTKVERVQPPENVPVRHTDDEIISNGKRLVFQKPENPGRGVTSQNAQLVHREDPSAPAMAAKSLSILLQGSKVRAQQPIPNPTTPPTRVSNQFDMDTTLVEYEDDEEGLFEETGSEKSSTETQDQEEKEAEEELDRMDDDGNVDGTTSEGNAKPLPKNQQAIHEVLQDLANRMVFHYGEVEAAVKAPVEQYKRGGTKLILDLEEARKRDFRAYKSSISEVRGRIRGEIEQMVKKLQSSESASLRTLNKKGIQVNMESSLNILDGWKGWDRMRKE